MRGGGGWVEGGCISLRVRGVSVEVGGEGRMERFGE